QVTAVGQDFSPADKDRIAELSLADPVHPVDLARAEITLAEKNVTIDAEVAMPDGRTATRTLVATLERATARAPARTGRWIVVRIRPAAGARTSRAASSDPPR